MLKKITAPNVLIILMLLSSVFLFRSANNPEIAKAQAGSVKNLSGWAWSENIGWLSFNSDNCDDPKFLACRDSTNVLNYSCDPPNSVETTCGDIPSPGATNIPPCTTSNQNNPPEYCVICPSGYDGINVLPTGTDSVWEKTLPDGRDACCSNVRMGGRSNGVGNCQITCVASDCIANGGGTCMPWCEVCRKSGVNYVCDTSSGSPDCPEDNPDQIIPGQDCYNIKGTFRVGIDDVTGDLTGYAWNPYVGWVSFDRIVTGNPPGQPYAADTGAIAKFDIADLTPPKQFFGWAKILVLGDAGWIKLSKDSSDMGSSYGVAMRDDGELDGYAWNGNDIASTGIGWIKFNNETAPASTKNFEVMAPIPYPEPKNVLVTSTTTLTTDDIDPCRVLTVSWDDVTNESGYSLFGTTTNGFIPMDGDMYIPPYGPDITEVMVQTIPYPDNPSLLPGTLYYFIVRAFNSFGFRDSAIASGMTYPICQTATETDLKGECPNIVHLRWTEPDKAASCTISEYVIVRCLCDNRKCDNCAKAPDDFNDPLPQLATTTVTNYDDMDFEEVNYPVFKWYKYSIKAVCATGEEGKWTDPNESDPVVPCPSTPTWIETKTD